MEDDKRVLIFTDGDEIYMFVYDPMDICSLLDAVIAQAKNEEIHFCWQDAFELLHSLLRPFFEEVHELSDILKDQSLG